MEGPTPLTERRLSSVVQPPWLQANPPSHLNAFATTLEGNGGNPNQPKPEVLIRENIYPIDINHSRSAIEKRSEFARQQESECSCRPYLACVFIKILQQFLINMRLKKNNNRCSL